MAQAQASANESPATYEIRLLGAPAQDLLQRLPAMSVRTERAGTLLFRQVEEPSELDVLLERLLSMGMVLTEVHEVPLPGKARASRQAESLTTETSELS